MRGHPGGAVLKTLDILIGLSTVMLLFSMAVTVVTQFINQIVNNLAKTHYRWGAPVPVVLRLPIGGGLHAGPFHSQNVESWFTGVAGLKVVAPATPFDAKGLLIAACEDGNPVLFLEHKWLYRSLKGRVPEGDYRVAIGRARRAREGSVDRRLESKQPWLQWPD